MYKQILALIFSESQQKSKPSVKQKTEKEMNTGAATLVQGAHKLCPEVQKINNGKINIRHFGQLSRKNLFISFFISSFEKS